MTTHCSIQVRDKFKDLVTDLDTTGENLFLGRDYELGEGLENALSLYLDDLNPVNPSGYTNIAFSDKFQEIIIRIHVKASEPDLDGLFLQIHSEIYAAIMADRTLGLAFVRDTIEFGFARPVYSSASGRPTVTVDTRWRVEYRHSLTDITA